MSLSASQETYVNACPRGIGQMRKPQQFPLVVYLLIFIYNICGDAFVYHFGEYGWSWGAVLLAGLLCQPHLVTFAAQWSLWVRDTHDTQENTSCALPTAASIQTKHFRTTYTSGTVNQTSWWSGTAGVPQPPPGLVGQLLPKCSAAVSEKKMFMRTTTRRFIFRAATSARQTRCQRPS